MQELVPTAFHRRLRQTLADQDPGLFRWYSSDGYEVERSDRLRLELLRSCYRLSPETHERPYRLAREAALRLGVEVPIVLYQLHRGEHANAGLYFAPDEAHVVLSGPLLASLHDDELLALFGHELAHHRLFTMEAGGFRAAADILEASVTHTGVAPPFVESTLRNRRWTEVFADRGAAIAAGGIDPAIACLVKVGTGLSEVSVTDYLAQAHEIVHELGKAGDQRGDTHPENAVRALALELWRARGEVADAEIAALIEGAATLETLDLVQQHDLAKATRAVIDSVLAPAWMRTETTLAHARAFFPDYSWSPPLQVERGPQGLDEYFAYVMLDFAVVDPSLEDVALARVLVAATDLGLRSAVVALVRKELKMTVAAIGQIEQRAPSLFERVSLSSAEGDA